MMVYGRPPLPALHALKGSKACLEKEGKQVPKEYLNR